MSRQKCCWRRTTGWDGFDQRFLLCFLAAWTWSLPAWRMFASFHRRTGLQFLISCTDSPPRRGQTLPRSSAATLHNPLCRLSIFPTSLIWPFPSEFQLRRALAHLMQFRFLTPTQQEEVASQQVGAKTTGLRCFPISHPLLSYSPRIHFLVIYLLRPVACEPESRRRRCCRHCPPSFSLFFSFTLKC